MAEKEEGGRKRKQKGPDNGPDGFEIETDLEKPETDDLLERLKKSIEKQEDKAWDICYC